MGKYYNFESDLLNHDFDNFVDSVNENYEGRIKVIQLVKKPPLLEFNEDSVVDFNYMDFSIYDGFEVLDRKAESWAAKLPYNDKQCYLREAPEISHNSMRFKCGISHYDKVMLFRKDLNRKFPLITGDALVVCDAHEEFVYQLRKQSNAFASNYLSIWGGGFVPKSFRFLDESIQECIAREFAEESKTQKNIQYKEFLNNEFYLILEEEKAGSDITGSIQTVALGVNINTELLGKIGDSHEATKRTIKIDKIYEELRTSNFTDYAEVSTLIWLYLYRRESVLETMQKLLDVVVDQHSPKWVKTILQMAEILQTRNRLNKQ